MHPVMCCPKKYLKQLHCWNEGLAPATCGLQGLLIVHVQVPQPLKVQIRCMSNSTLIYMPADFDSSQTGATLPWNAASTLPLSPKIEIIVCQLLKRKHVSHFFGHIY